jgi:hypothetical protein
VSKGTQIAVAALLVAALVGWYGWTSLGAAGASGSALLHGYVAVGSIERDLETPSKFQAQATEQASF